MVRVSKRPDPEEENDDDDYEDDGISWGLIEGASSKNIGFTHFDCLECLASHLYRIVLLDIAQRRG